MVTGLAAQLVVVVPPELASGFRMAGVDVHESSDADAAARFLDAALDEGGRSVVGVYSPYLPTIDSPQYERCERSIAPIVVPLPSGLEALEGIGRRARLAALLQRAVGYHITFGDET